MTRKRTDGSNDSDRRPGASGTKQGDEPMKPMNLILAIILLRIADVLWKHVSLIPTLAEATS